MLPNKFKPLELNPDTGEPFLRLPAPHNNIIITAPRLEDASPIVPVLNDPKVCKYLLGPPHPYLQEHADSFQGLIKSEADLLINEISSKDPGAIVGGCPVRTLREVQPDGTELFLGDIAVRRHDWAELDDERERTALKEENMARDVGDPNILWAFGGMWYLRCDAKPLDKQFRLCSGKSSGTRHNVSGHRCINQRVADTPYECPQNARVGV